MPVRVGRWQAQVRVGPGDRGPMLDCPQCLGTGVRQQRPRVQVVREAHLLRWHLAHPLPVELAGGVRQGAPVSRLRPDPGQFRVVRVQRREAALDPGIVSGVQGKAGGVYQDRLAVLGEVGQQVGQRQGKGIVVAGPCPGDVEIVRKSIVNSGAQRLVGAFRDHAEQDRQQRGVLATAGPQRGDEGRDGGPGGVGVGVRRGRVQLLGEPAERFPGVVGRCGQERIQIGYPGQGLGRKYGHGSTSVQDAWNGIPPPVARPTPSTPDRADAKRSSPASSSR